MKAIIENIKLGFQMIIIGTLLLFIGVQIFMPEMSIKIFRFQPFIVVTESMEPYMEVNDLVVATPFNIEEAKVGDIITFNADIDYNGTKEIVTHYIYEIDKSDGEAIIKTNRHFEDGETVVPDTWLIPESEVIGSYGTHIPYVGYAIGFITSIYGVAIIGINIAIYVTIKHISKRSKRFEENQDLDDKTNNFQTT